MQSKSKSQRITRFPGVAQATSLKLYEKDVKKNRQTRFPGGTELQKISILETDRSSIKTKAEKAT